MSKKQVTLIELEPDEVAMRITAVGHDGSYSASGLFAVKAEVMCSARDEVVKVIKAFRSSEEGKKIIEDDCCGGFNWGDALVKIPNHFWEEAGIRPLPEPFTPVVLTVEHDEWLGDEEEGL